MSEEPMDRPTNVLVVGAREGSLGYWIAAHLSMTGARVHAAGVAGEPVELDITDHYQCEQAVARIDPTHVVCTAGINRGLPFYADGWETVARDAMDVNYYGPMNLLAAFEDWLDGWHGSFVAISSNSARIARSSSSAYCASKAALSMGLRCAARDLTRAGKPLRVWGYEPGALDGTPMTRAVAGRLGKDVPMSRMLTRPQGLDVRQVARMVARDLLDAGDVLHGTIVPLDNGDQ